MRSPCALVLLLLPLLAAPTAAQTYQNPLENLNGLADPHVIRVDGTYYLYPTSHTDGYDVWTSTDLVSWKHAGRVFDDPRGGAWAPNVFHNARGDGKFYLYYTDDDPEADSGPGPFDKQIGVAVADKPLGPFVDKGPLVKGVIDAHMFQDDDGRLYLYYVNIADGFKILAQPMSDPLTTTGEPIEILHPTESWETAAGEVTEGPFILKRKGVYYLMYSGSGADSPHYAIGYATSDAPTGPFKKHPGNPIAKRIGEVVGPGHHCVVTGPDGKLWMIYHQKYDDSTSYRRFVALDPLWFDDEGVMHAKVSRRSDEPGPSKRD